LIKDPGFGNFISTNFMCCGIRSLDPDTDTDPDPAFQMNPDPNTDPGTPSNLDRIQIHNTANFVGKFCLSGSLSGPLDLDKNSVKYYIKLAIPAPLYQCQWG
jgi:hypothetical protein